jgi:hypothetical protein
VHQSFTLMPRPGGGVLARLVIPCAPATVSATVPASVAASVR